MVLRSVVVLGACVLPAAAFLAGPSLPAVTAGREPTLPALRCQAPSPFSRRDTIRLLGAGTLAVLNARDSLPAGAFDNAIEDYAKYAKKPKRRGDAPKDLGVSQRTINADSIDSDPKTFQGLRGCDGKTNCFSTTGDDLLDDRIRKGFDTLIKPWMPPAGDKAPFKTLVDQVKTYEPGQSFIDGGGFQVVKATDSYLYVQFESLKKGYIDDVEFAISEDRKGVQVRSSSRVGSSDFGVNAKRLNYIAAGLREKGWSIDEISPASHPDYFYAAADAADQTFDPDRRKGTEVEKGRLERPNFGNRAVLK